MTTLQILQKRIDEKARSEACIAWKVKADDFRSYLAAQGFSVNEALMLLNGFADDRDSVDPPQELVDLMKDKIILRMMNTKG